ncbi:hypothetical protein [Catenulispora rubra]|uniref:hypothetical protein n=1 Tax=Catenulispora rubra TaxID=280293 RepID=UPI001E62AC37|nr:hypothetical protein [Catenulispora rubra]
MLFAVGSWRGAPGVTTTALALAESWPGPQSPVVLECDPRGGSVACRFLIPGSRTVEALASAARHGGDARLLAEHTRTTSAGAAVVTAPEDGERLRPLIAALAKPGGLLSTVAADSGAVMFADCGRLDPRDAETRAVLACAESLILVIRPVVEHALGLKAVLGQIRELHRDVGLVLVGPGYSSAELTWLLELPVWGTLPLLPTGTTSRAVERLRRDRTQAGFREAAAGVADVLIERRLVAGSAPHAVRMAEEVGASA